MAQAGEGSIAVQVVDTVTVVVLRGEHDLATVPMLEEALSRACADGPTLVDLTDVAFIDSSSLGVLVDHRDPGDSVSEWSGLAVVMPSEERVLDLLRLVNMGEILPLFQNVSDAMAAVAVSARPPEIDPA